MDNKQEIANNILVKLFNQILFSEEQTLRQKIGNDLSMKDIHIIEAIDVCKNQFTAGSVAKQLNITLGTLTIAINRLVTKGYVVRKRVSDDKRKVQLSLTEKGIEVNKIHQNFHRQMADNVLKDLNKTEQDILIHTLNKISEIFAIKE